MRQEELKGIFEFLHETEQLKTLLRHSWLSSGRRESVAEHTWRLALMAIILRTYLDKEIDLLQSLKIIIVHDLGEIYAKDTPAFKKRPADKSARERKAMVKLLRPLAKDLRVELLGLWEEYESGKSLEAKFAKALDKLEVLLQHNEADYKFMTRKEYAFNFSHGLEQVEYDSFLKEFRELLNDEFRKGYKKHKVDLSLYKDYA